jgi:hypothetical protein
MVLRSVVQQYDRLAKLERAFKALLENIASNPHHAVEIATEILNEE